MNNAKNIIRLSKSCIGESEKKAVLEVLDKEYLGMGAEVNSFENELSQFFNRSAVCVVNGTAALHLSLQAANISRGDEVLVPSLTYVASFQAISSTGARPIACDIDPITCLLDIFDAEKKITSKTKAIMPVHYTGYCGDLDLIYNFAKKYKLRVIEDAAHAFGSHYKNRLIGSFGDIACFSFDGIKNITSGEGGCVVTNNSKILSRIKDARLLGVERDSEKRFSGKRSWDFDVKKQGWRYHMSDIMAAIGRQQLKKYSSFASKRKNIAEYYNNLFKSCKNIKPIVSDFNNIVPHIYVIRVLGMKNRRNIQSRMLDKGIQVGYHYQPNHLLSYFSLHNKVSLPATEAIFPELLSLPLHPDLSLENVDFIFKS